MLIGLDYFDASINRVAAWIVGMRNMQKALLFALLMPQEKMKTLQNAGEFTELMAVSERVKEMPFGDVWEEYLRRENVGGDWLAEVKEVSRKACST